MSSKLWLVVPTSMSLLVFGGAVLVPAPGFAQQRNPDRDAYFGETHVHTSWSLDAFAIGNLHHRLPATRTSTSRASRSSIPLGYDVKIDTPLDWAGVTDHSEYAGVRQPGERAGLPGQQAARGAAADPEGQDEGRDGAGRAVRHQHLGRRTAGQGADVARGRRHGLEARTSRSPTRPTSRASSRRSARTSGPRCRTT